MIDFPEKTLADKPEISINRWLLLLLILAVILTLWMMLRQETTDTDHTIEVINQKNAVQDPIAKLSSVNITPSKKGVLMARQQPLIPWQKLEREPLSSQPHDLFKVHSWLVLAPVRKAKPLPAPLPVAPPAPFTYLGKLDDSPTGTQFFLMENGRLFSVLKGEKIDRQWRLDNEDASSLHLTFLPLNLPQTLTKASKSVFLPGTVPESQPVESPPAELNL